LWVHNYSVYGRRKLWKAARRSGIDAGRDQVARLMRAPTSRGTVVTNSTPWLSPSTRGPERRSAGRRPPKHSTSFYNPHDRLVLRQPLEPKQYTSIAYTERLCDIGAAPSIGTVGDSYDNAMAESVMGLFKTELHRNPAALEANGGLWKGLDDFEPATCAWVSWFNEERLHSELDDMTPAEFEVDYRHKSQANAA
jgi:putative transposase